MAWLNSGFESPWLHSPEAMGFPDNSLVTHLARQRHQSSLISARRFVRRARTSDSKIHSVGKLCCADVRFMNAGTAEESLAPIAYSRFSETEEAALRWFLAGAGKIKLPFDTRTYTVRSFRKAKFKSAFWGTFVVTGLITLIAVGSGVQAALTATSLDDLCARLADAPIIAAVLVGGHVFFAAVVFLMIGGLGGSQLAKPDEQLAIRATRKELTIARHNQQPVSGPWNVWKIGAIETTPAYEGPSAAIVRALEFVRTDLVHLAMASFVIVPEQLIRGDRFCASGRVHA